MKYIFSFLLLSFSYANAQTAQEIVNKHLQAIGGKAKITAITSYSYEMGNSRFEMHSRMVYYKSPGKWRIVLSEDNKVVHSSIFHGEKGWVTFASGETQVESSGIDFNHPLLGYLLYATTPDFKIEYLGPDTQSDNLLLQVTALLNNILGNSYTYYINPNTYLVTKVEVNSNFPSTLYFRNYTTLNGITIPLKTTTIDKYKGDSTFEIKTNVKINIPLDDKLFLKPALKKELKAFKNANNKWGFQDENFVTVIKAQFDEVWDFHEDNLAKVSINKLYGHIDTKGKIIVPLKYEKVENFDEGMAGVMLKGKWGFVNKTGKEAEPLKYEKIKDFRDGLAAVKLNNKWGFIDKTMKVIIPLQYDDVGYFYEGLSYVMLNNKYGYADKTGTIVIPMEYDFAMYFDKGKAKVKKDNVYFSIDKTGKKID